MATILQATERNDWTVHVAVSDRQTVVLHFPPGQRPTDQAILAAAEAAIAEPTPEVEPEPAP